MNIEVIKTIIAFLIVLLVVADIIISIKPAFRSSKRELREKIKELMATVAEKERKNACLDIELAKAKAHSMELEKAVAFYKAECGYYKAQAEKNLALLLSSTEKAKGGK